MAKRLIGIILAAIMVIGLVPMTVFAKSADAVQTKDADLDSALNVSGGTLTFDDVEDKTPWIVSETSDTGHESYATSGNYHVNSSVSSMSLTCDVTEGQSFAFDYKISSESGWDRGRFSIDGVLVPEFTGTVASRPGLSGTINWTTYTKTFTADEVGEHTFLWEYEKDSSSSTGDDIFAVDNVQIISPVAVTDVTIEPVTVDWQGTAQAVYTITPSSASVLDVVFDTADHDIATVDVNGVVTGVNPGTTSISITSVVNPNVTASAAVTVNGPQYIYDFEGEYDNLAAYAADKELTVINNNNDNKEWAFSTGANHGGVRGISISYNTSMNHDDWVILPCMKVNGNATFSMWAKSGSDYYKESFDICIGYSMDLASMTRVDGDDEVPNAWTNYTVDLREYVGEYIYIAFVATAKDKMSLYVDDVTLWGDIVRADPEPEEIVVEDITLVVGTEGDAVYSVLPLAADQSATFASSNTDIFTVDSATGHITAVGVGSASLIVTSTVNPRVEGAGTVTVTGEIYPTEIIVEDIEVYQDYAEEIVYSFDPTTTNMTDVTFASSDEGIFYVEDGYVIGVSGGTATLTVTCAYEGHTDVVGTATVTVVGPSVEFYFDEDPLENGWQFIEGDSYGLNWGWDEGGYIYHQYESGQSADDAVAPRVLLGSGEVLVSVDACIQNTSYPETLGLYVGTSLDELELVDTITVTNDTSSIERYYFDPIPSKFANQPVYIVLRYMSNNMYVLYILDVYVWGDAELYNPDPEEIVISDLTVKETVSVDFPIQVLPVEAPQDVTVVVGDDRIATYNAETGKITGVSVGETTVTVTCKDFPEISATATITVESAIYPEDIQGLPTSLEIVGTESTTYQLTWTVLPAEADNKNVFFTVADPTIATVSETGLITALKDGETVITVTCEANPRVSAAIRLTASNIPIGSWHFDENVDPTTYGWTFANYGEAGGAWSLDYGSGLDTHDGSGMLRSNSYVGSTAYVADAWAITPAINTDAAGNIIRFYSWSQDSSWLDNLEVFVGTSANPEDYYDFENEEYIIEPLLSMAMPKTPNVPYQLSLPGDSTVYVLFRHNDYNNFYLLLDAIDVLPMTEPESVTVEDITLERGLSALLEVNFQPDGCADGYEAVVADESVAIFVDGRVFAVGEGDTTITVTSTVDDSVTATANIHVDAPTIEWYFDSANNYADNWVFSDEADWDHFETNDLMFANTLGYSMMSYSGSYMITPGIEVSEGTTDAVLKLYARSRYGSETSLEGITVLVGTTADISSMTTIIDDVSVPGNFTAYEIDLADYAGQVVYVAIYHTSGTSELFVDTVQVWGDVAIAAPVAEGPVVTGVQVNLRERTPEDGKADVRFKFTVEFNDTYVLFTPEGGTQAQYGSHADNAVEITGIQAVLQLIPAVGDPYSAHTVNINNIFFIDDTTSDVNPYFQVTVTITGISPARFDDTYSASLIVIYGGEQATCDPCLVTVNTINDR